MLLQLYFPFPILNRKTQKRFFISWVYCLHLQRFLYLMTVKLPKVRNNLLEENTCFQQIFIGTEKKRKDSFLLSENMENTRKNQISIYLRTMIDYTYL